MDGNRVDLGNVKGDRGITGVGISTIIELPYDEDNLQRTYRIYYSDSTEENPHYFEYTLTDNSFIRRLNELTTGSPSSDYESIPTMYLLKTELNKRPLNVDVYRKEQLYTKNEVDSAISTAIGELELIEVVTQLPTSDIKDNRLYMVTKNNDSSDNLNPTFDLYVYVNGDWKKLDGLNFSIANYPTTTQMNTQLANKQDISNISNNIQTDASSTTKYPSVSSIKNYVDDLIGDIIDYIES